MNYIKDPKFKGNLLIATYVIILSYVFLNLATVFKFLGGIVGIIKPFLIAIAIAFVLNIPMKLFEEKILIDMSKSKKDIVRKMRRPLALTLTLVTVIGLIIGLVVFILPQLAESVSTLTKTIPHYVDSFEDMVNQYAASTDLFNNIWDEFLAVWKDVLQVAGQITGSLLTQVVNMTIGVTSSIVNFFIGLILAIYMLLSKEKLSRQSKKFIYAFSSERTSKKIMEIAAIANIKFSRFIAGQCTEAVILGTLCFIGMSIFRMPYALLISTIVGVTALVPIFGALIGTIPGAFIILMISPKMAIWFIVLIIVIQQIEGNLIYPIVVGNSIGLSAIWVMFAMIVGGSVFGILGMLIGIPLFGVIYTLLSSRTNKKLKDKGISIDN